VAVACCRREVDSAPNELYPDPDLDPLLAAFAAAGVPATALAWDDPAVRWDSFSPVLVSSTWDSVDRPGEYLAWVRSVASRTTLVNPADVLAWNLDKRYLRDLAAGGVPIVPTTWVESGSAVAWPDAHEVVVKPAVSAGGRQTARYSAGDVDSAGSHVRALVAAGQTVLIQPYLSEIDAAGEHDLIFIGGQFSHAVIKKPLLQAGEGVVERLWERLTFAGLATPSDGQMEVAATALGVLEARFGGPPVYARVDLIGEIVLEVELVDPYLSLDEDGAGPAASRLVDVVLAT
jgi:glutathione synthase/RimK-type ligase-like ATP-grasp enzyme